MTRNEKQLILFLTRELAMARPKGETLAGFYLRRVGDKRTKPITTFVRTARLAVTEIELIASSLLQAAQNDAETRGLQRHVYVVQAYTNLHRMPYPMVQLHLKAKRRDDRITVRLPSNLRAAIEREAETERRSIADLIIFTLEARFMRSAKGAK